jgi:hypothetical protein
VQPRAFALCAAVALLGGAAFVGMASAQSASVVCCDANSASAVSSPQGIACTASSGHCAAPSADAQIVFQGSGSVTVRVETTEPPEGFTGACLLPALTYSPQLPTVCYTPVGSVSYGGNQGTELVASAAKVSQAHWSLAANYDSYRVLTTCYPKPANAGCTRGLAASRSCCDPGGRMITTDGGQTAWGYVNFGLK